MSQSPPNQPDTPAGDRAAEELPAVAVVVSRYNARVTDRLLEGARGEYTSRGGSEWMLGVFEVPGAFELPAIAGVISRLKGWHGIVCLGCVIKGETRHDEHIATAVTGALANIATRSGVPIGYGVITADTPDQALARAGGDKGNKGAEAMAAVLESMKVMATLRAGAEARYPGGAQRSRVAGDLPDKTNPGGA